MTGYKVVARDGNWYKSIFHGARFKKWEGTERVVWLPWSVSRGFSIFEDLQEARDYFKRLSRDMLGTDLVLLKVNYNGSGPIKCYEFEVEEEICDGDSETSDMDSGGCATSCSSQGGV